MHGRIDGSVNLPDSGVRIGCEGQVKLQVAGGNNGYLRLKQGESLHLELEIIAEASAPGARLYSDINSCGSFAEYSMVARDDRKFALSIATDRPGNYHFTIKYTLDGQFWFWIRGDFWRTLVFPQVLQALRMYTLIPNASGTMDQWTGILQRAADLNFNMIHILPVTKQGISHSPYAAADLFAIEPYYLPQGADPSSMEPFEKLVAEARRLNLGICIDLVLNHVAVESLLAQRCPHWIVADPTEADGLRRNGYFGHDGFHKWEDLALIHYKHPDLEVRREIWEYMEAYAFFWARYAAESGGMIRLDNLHSTDISFAMHLTRRLRQEFPQLGILGELFASSDMTQKIIQFCSLDLLLATTWEHHFTQELRRYFRYIHEAKPPVPWFTPVNSHDSGVPAEEFADVCATQPRYILCTLLGIGTTGLTQGVEFGVDKKLAFIGRTPSSAIKKAIDFSPMIKRAHELLVQYSAFQQQGNVEFLDHGHMAIIAALRRAKNSSEPHAIVIANLDIHQRQSIGLDLQSIGLGLSSLIDAFSQSSFRHDGQHLQLVLEPCGFQVFLTEKI